MSACEKCGREEAVEADAGSTAPRSNLCWRALRPQSAEYRRVCEELANPGRHLKRSLPELANQIQRAIFQAPGTAVPPTKSEEKLIEGRILAVLEEAEIGGTPGDWPARLDQVVAQRDQKQLELLKAQQERDEQSKSSFANWTRINDVASELGVNYHTDALAAAVALKAERDALLADSQCGTCCGTPHASDKVCVCGGKNTARAEADGLRKAWVAEQREWERINAKERSSFDNYMANNNVLPGLAALRVERDALKSDVREAKIEIGYIEKCRLALGCTDNKERFVEACKRVVTERDALKARIEAKYWCHDCKRALLAEEVRHHAMVLGHSANVSDYLALQKSTAECAKRKADNAILWERVRELEQVLDPLALCAFADAGHECGGIAVVGTAYCYKHIAKVLHEALGKEVVVRGPQRRRLPDERDSVTRKFKLHDEEGKPVKGYMTVSFYEDGVTPGELFMVIDKGGSTVRGLTDGLATQTSISLQYGVPLDALATKMIATRFFPAGATGEGEAGIAFASSVLDYVFRRFLKIVEERKVKKVT